MNVIFLNEEAGDKRQENWNGERRRSM